jgi:hypothetical protein
MTYILCLALVLPYVFAGKVLSSHLACTFPRGIPQFLLYLWSTTVPSTLGLLKSVPLNYIWMPGFKIQPSGHQTISLVSGGDEVGVRSKP